MTKKKPGGLSLEIKVAKNATKHKPSQFERAIASLRKDEWTANFLDDMEAKFGPERGAAERIAMMDTKAIELMSDLGLNRKVRIGYSNPAAKQTPVADARTKEGKKEIAEGGLSKKTVEHYKKQEKAREKLIKTIPTEAEYKKMKVEERAGVMNRLMKFNEKYNPNVEPEPGSAAYKAETEEMRRRMFSASDEKIPPAVKAYLIAGGDEAIRDFAKFIAKMKSKAKRMKGVKYKVLLAEFYRSADEAMRYHTGQNDNSLDSLYIMNFIKYRASIHGKAEAEKIITEAANWKNDDGSYVFDNNSLLDYMNSFMKTQEYVKENGKVIKKRKEGI